MRAVAGNSRTLDFVMILALVPTLSQKLIIKLTGVGYAQVSIHTGNLFTIAVEYLRWHTLVSAK